MGVQVRATVPSKQGLFFDLSTSYVCLPYGNSPSYTFILYSFNICVELQDKKDFKTLTNDHH